MTPYQRYISNCPTFPIVEEKFNEIVLEYNRPHRFFHTFEHVEHLWTLIDSNIHHVSSYQMNKEEVELMYVAALFHDVVYYPSSKTNEEDSVSYFNSIKFINTAYGGINSALAPKKELVNKLILGTKDHKTVIGVEELSNKLNMFDMGSVFYDIEENESKIVKEYQLYPIDDYRKGRIQFLQTVETGGGKRFDYMLSRVSYVSKRKYNIGVFAGSFAPFHSGHLNALEKMEKVFDKVIILCAVNSTKVCDLESNVNGVKSVLPFHEVVGWTGLVTDYVKKVQDMGANVTICKGFRNDHDIPYEMNLYQFTKDLMPDVSVAYFPCDIGLSHVSSSAIKNLSKYSDISKYIPTKFSYYKKD